MPESPRTEESIFAQALEKATPAERAAFLNGACRADAALRARVEELLRSHDQAGSFLSKPAVDEGATGAYTPKSESHEPHTVEAGRSAEGPGTRIGPYKLLQIIGEGGMGTVYMAEQQEPVRRLVALKIIKAGMNSREVVARFEAERQALALMEHPNIAKVLDAGTTGSVRSPVSGVRSQMQRVGDQGFDTGLRTPDSGLVLGRPYFVMELVKGIPITKYCDEHRLTPRQRLELFMPVCHALQHAHQKGIIHRDIKPSNVLVAPYDGKPVIKVIDFGVAKATGQRLTERTMFTEFGAVIGTLEYMSPEQAELNNQDIDTRSDIYSLGVLLYELLTGTTPLDRSRLKKAAFTEMLRIIREEEPPRPSMRLSGSNELPSISAQRQTEPAKLSKLMRGELDWIVMKSLEKDRTRRYETANGLARDIERYLTDEPVEACPPSAGYRMKKFLRRNKGVMTAAAVVMGVLVCGVIGTTSGMLTAQRASDLALRAVRDADEHRALVEKERDNAQKARDAEKERSTELDRALNQVKDALHESEQNLNHGRILLAESAWNQSGSAEWARHYLSLIPATFRNWEWGHLQRKYQGGLFTHYGHSGRVNCVAFSPDGSRLASASEDNTVRLWEAKTARLLLELKGHEKEVLSVAFSPDGSRLASGSGDYTVLVWETKSGQKLLELQGPTGRVSCLAFSPDGTRLAGTSDDGTVRVWYADSGARLQQLKGHLGWVRSVAFSPDGSLLASASDSQDTVLVWDTKSWEQLLMLKGHTGNVQSVAFSPDGSRLASASLDATVRVWEIKRRQQLMVLTGHTDQVISVAFSPDGIRVASASLDKTVRLWDAKSGHQLLELKGHTGTVSSVAFSLDASRLVSASWDKTVKVWEVKTGQQILELKGHKSEVSSVAFSPDGSRLGTASGDNTVRLWEAKSGTQILELKGHTREVTSVAFSPDGSRLASASLDQTVRVWEPKTGQQLLRLNGGYTREACSVAFSPDGSRLASTGGSTVRVWEANTGQQVLQLKGHTAAVTSVAFSPDGSRLASTSPDDRETVRIWHAKSGQQLLGLKGPTGRAWGLAFNPAGSRLATASDDNTVRVWDAKTGQQLLELKGHTRPVLNVSFSPDGSRLGSASQDKTVRVWDSKSGQHLLELKGHGGPVFSVAFSPDGSRLASASGDKTVRVWEGRPQQTELDQDERFLRLGLARPDPWWHTEMRLQAEKEKNTFAAAFHRSWEQHACGVLVFEAGDFNMAYAHFIAAAALKPKVPDAGK